jgi:hypothetical protein
LSLLFVAGVGLVYLHPRSLTAGFVEQQLLALLIPMKIPKGIGAQHRPCRRHEFAKRLYRNSDQGEYKG